MIKNIPVRINSSLDQGPAAKYGDALLSSLVEGAIDFHCHSGPRVMPRCIDHIEFMKEGSEAGLRAILIKDHYYSATLVEGFKNVNATCPDIGYVHEDIKKMLGGNAARLMELK